MNTIFIQIASYRDPQLPITLKNCIDNAKYPKNLRFCIAHQYDETEDLSEFEKDKRFDFIKIPYAESKGACWARNQIQQRYNGEKYTLQLDSHHRFEKDWDDTCIKMIKGLQKKGYKKPLLTAYLPSFDPENDPEKRTKEPWQMNFDKFIPEGAVFFLPGGIPNWKELTEPVRARFYSAHFCFTIGEFAKEVQHDPNYYFHGEEISIGVRAFTHGYDLFHPHKIVAYHEYTRKGRTKHWDDDKQWHLKNSACHLRNRKLFGMDGVEQDIDFGIYGFGKERTLRDYEEYAGISFAKRAIQQYTNNSRNYPPNPKVEDFDASFQKSISHTINIKRDKFPETDYKFWAVIYKAGGVELYRRDVSGQELANKLSSEYDVLILRNFNSDMNPDEWIVWPYSESKGWLEPIKKSLKNENYNSGNR